MFHVLLLAVYLFVLLRFVVPLPLPASLRIAIAVALLVVSKHHLLTLLAFGSMFSPEVPRFVIVLFGWAFCAFLFVFVLTLLADFVTLVLRIWRPGPPSPSTARNRGLAIALAAAALSAGGVGNALQFPEVKRIELEVRELPQALDGFRIVQLTDLHIARLFDGSWADEVVRRANALKPDLVLITGDLIDGKPKVRMQDVRPLGDLKARNGVITILGNHEYYLGADRWSSIFEELGMRVLVNEHTVVDVGGARLVVAGTADEAALPLGRPGPDVVSALSGAPDGAPTILLGHRPGGAAANARAGVDIQLSGHTHGGMVWGFDRIVARANQGYVSGRYEVGGMQLYVSNGTGLWNGFPIRLGVPSEITEITLRRPR